MKTRKLAQWAIVNLVMAVALAGCGNDNEGKKSSANGTALSSTTPAGAVTNPSGGGPLPPPTGGPGGSGGDREIYKESFAGNGPLTGATTSSCQYVGRASNLGLNSLLRVQMEFGEATNSTGTGGRQNYNTISANVHLRISGRSNAIETIRVSANRDNTANNIADFSGAWNSYKGTDNDVWLCVADIMSDYRSSTGVCESNYNNCCTTELRRRGIYHITTCNAACDFGLCSLAWSCYYSAYQPCAGASAGSGVTSVNSTAGWTFKLRVETDMTTPRLTE